MKYKSIYEDCKNLVSYGVTGGDSKNFRHETYLDSFGCDLQIYLNCMLCHLTGKMQESIKVYLGGRKVYSFSDGRPDNEYAVGGYWRKLISELRHYELARYLEESYVLNDTLLELCRRESARNRKIMNKYCELCLLLAKQKGEMKIISEKTHYYKFEGVIDGHKIRVYMTERTPSGKISHEDNVELSFDKKSVFSFYFNSNDAGGLFDDKGDYTPGEWEKILERLAEGL